MKIRSLISNVAVLTFGVFSLGFLSVAQAEEGKDEKKPNKPGDRPPGGSREFNPEERLKAMVEHLGLTEDQQAKMREVFAKNAPAMKELMAKGKGNLTEDEQKKLRELFKSQKEAMDAILTPEQKAKLPQRPGGPDGNRVDGRKKGEDNVEAAGPRKIGPKPAPGE